MWIVDSNTTDKVFKYAVSGSLVGSWTIDSANKSPTGLTIDPTGASQSIWIVDNGTDRVYEYTNARGLRSGSRSAASSFALAAGNSNPQGIADPPPVGTSRPSVQPTAQAMVIAMAPPVNHDRREPAFVGVVGNGLDTINAPQDLQPAVYTEASRLWRSVPLPAVMDRSVQTSVSNSKSPSNATDTADRVFEGQELFDTIDDA